MRIASAYVHGISRLAVLLSFLALLIGWEVIARRKLSFTQSR